MGVESKVSSVLASNHPSCLVLLGKCRSMTQLIQIQAQMIRNHLSQDPFAASKLIEFCAVRDVGNIHYARKLFDEILNPNVFTWNTIIRGYATSPSPKHSLLLFNQMLHSGASPNAFTFPFLIKACSRLSLLEHGMQLHALICKYGTATDTFSLNALIHMYSTCGRIHLANRLFLFTAKTTADMVTWNSLLSGYVHCGLIGQAQTLFDHMPQKGLVSWNVMITGYSKCGNIHAARILFDNMPTRNAESWNALIAGYAKCGLVQTSRRIFDEMPVPQRNAVSWSTIIAAHAQSHQPNKALALFDEMSKAKVYPNWATIVSALSACAQVGALDRGKQIHLYVDQSKMRTDSIIRTALIDMYAKCGSIENAQRVFDALGSKDVFSWTAMIGGLAVNGHANRALQLFAEMEDARVRPNEVTFVGVLCACSHGGLVEMAKHYFDSMTKVYNIDPTIEHYTCMVDTLGRAGHLKQALSFAESIPGKPNSVLWGALLGACWIHKDAKVGEHVGDRLTQLDPDDAGIYVLLANIYATVGRWEDARHMRSLMESKSLQKSPGCSSIEIQGTIHEFYVGDKSHPRIAEINLKLAEMTSRLKHVGYTPDTSSVLFDIEDEDKEDAVWQHSERLAIAFGLIAIGTESCFPIRIVKNLRVCGDCHTAAKLISKAFDRFIIVRDRNVFHYFRDGSCSCKDYW